LQEASEVREELDIPMPAMGPASYRTPRRRPGMDPNTRRLALIAGGIGGALVLLVGAWSFSGHHRGGVPVIAAEKGPLRVKPENPGGMAVAGENESILSGQTDGKTEMAPAPEVPEPQALQAQEQKAATAAAPPAPAPPVAAPAPAVQAAAPPAPKPAPARPAAVARTAPAPVAHGPQVQLAALGSEEAARIEWHRLEHKLPAMLDGRKPDVTRIEHDGKTFWRLRTGGFTSTAEATSFCDKAKAKGVGCAVASF
jgi:hypothetical protein